MSNVVQVCTSMQPMIGANRSCRYMLKTACTARHAALRIRPRISSGQFQKEEEVQITLLCDPAVTWHCDVVMSMLSLAQVSCMTAMSERQLHLLFVSCD